MNLGEGNAAMGILYLGNLTEKPFEFNENTTGIAGGSE
jgi:hypothetical protein